MKIGILKETQSGEKRIALVPEAVAALAAAGAKVVMETGAGIGAGYADEAFVRAGAEILASAPAVLETADLVIKVKGPVTAEFDFFRPGQALFCFLVARNRPKLVDFLLARRLTALAFEAVESDDGRFPLLEPMSAIAGRQAVIIGQGLLAGPVRRPASMPARVVVLGGGTAGTAAARTEASFGSVVDLFEIDPRRLESLKTLLPGPISVHPVPDHRLAEIVAAADLVINTAPVPARSPVHLVDRATVARMQPGRVIVDVSATIGGAVETIDRITTHADPVFVAEGVVHYAVPNIPARFAPAASEALSRSLLPYALQLAADGLPAALERCPDLRRALVCTAGVLTNRSVAESQGRPWQGMPQH